MGVKKLSITVHVLQVEQFCVLLVQLKIHFTEV